MHYDPGSLTRPHRAQCLWPWWIRNTHQRQERETLFCLVTGDGYDIGTALRGTRSTDENIGGRHESMCKRNDTEALRSELLVLLHESLVNFRGERGRLSRVRFGGGQVGNRGVQDPFGLDTKLH